ncbi:MAG TPA: histidine phosphatase family protein [Candidatus Saccharimonadales bacterium]|nr:histidine phosphatase family protein [Candidatus Saccharimonadales bacterium]
MNRFYIIRHGETENNRAGRLSGWIDTPLTADGLVPTARAVAKLHSVQVAAVVSSDLGRAFVTAYTAARQLGFAGEIMRLPGLREVNYGVAANMPKTEAYSRYPGLDQATDYTPPEGESLGHMQKRVVETLNTLNEKYNDADILVVAHSGVMAALHASFTGGDFGEYNFRNEYPHDLVLRVTLDGGRVASFDEVG